MSRGYSAALWLLLVVSVLAIALLAVAFIRESQSIKGLSTAALERGARLEGIATLLLVSAEVLAIVLASLARRWGWLVASVLLPVSIVVFAIVMLLECRSQRSDEARQASFESALTRALAEQAVEGPSRPPQS